MPTGKILPVAETHDHCSHSVRKKHDSDVTTQILSLCKLNFSESNAKVKEKFAASSTFNLESHRSSLSVFVLSATWHDEAIKVILRTFFLLFLDFAEIQFGIRQQRRYRNSTRRRYELDGGPLVKAGVEAPIPLEIFWQPCAEVLGSDYDSAFGRVQVFDCHQLILLTRRWEESKQG